MVVEDDMRAEVTEVLLPAHAKLDAIDAKSERETKNLNERMTAIERVICMCVASRDRRTRFRTCGWTVWMEFRAGFQ